MKYTVIDLFGTSQANGTFDDIFSTEKYSNLKEAYAANDYVKCNYVQDSEGILYIEAKHVQNPNEKQYHRLEIQRPVCGIDVIDDTKACQMAAKMLT